MRRRGGCHEGRGEGRQEGRKEGYQMMGIVEGVEDVRRMRKEEEEVITTETSKGITTFRLK